MKKIKKKIKLISYSLDDCAAYIAEELQIKLPTEELFLFMLHEKIISENLIVLSRYQGSRYFTKIKKCGDSPVGKSNGFCLRVTERGQRFLLEKVTAKKILFVPQAEDEQETTGRKEAESLDVNHQ